MIADAAPDAGADVATNTPVKSGFPVTAADTSWAALLASFPGYTVSKTLQVASNSFMVSTNP